MKFNILDFWGKANESTLYPALYHMVDVAIVSMAILDRLSNQEQKKLLAPFASCENPRTVFALIIALHDIGKFTPSFQYKRKDLIRFDITYFKRGDCQKHHGELGYLILYEKLIDELGLKKPVARSLATSVASHHGKLEWADPDRHHFKSWRDVQATAFEWLLNYFDVGWHDINIDSSAVDSQWLMQMSGLCSVADWLGSQEEYFSYDVSDYLSIALEREQIANNLLDRLKIKAQSLDVSKEYSFDLLFGFKKNQAQSRILEIFERFKNPGLVIIELPMGWGKTELALELYRLYAKNYDNKGLYFALPTQNTGNQMFKRVGNFYNQYPSIDGKVDLHLCHSNAQLNDHYNELLLSEIYDPNIQKKGAGKIAANQWFASRKRGLLSESAVGTIDQLLLSVMLSRHQFVRLFGLLGRVLVLDEVHSYPAYTEALMNGFLTWMGRLNVPVVLLSATLPHEKRQGFIEAYSGKKATFNDQPYPRLTIASAAGETSPSEVLHSSIFRDNKEAIDPKKATSYIRLHTNHHSKWLTMLAEDAVRDYSEGGNGAYIVNTVGGAQKLYDKVVELLSGDRSNVTLYHARMDESRRSQIECNLEHWFGKNKVDSLLVNPNRPKRHIVIASPALGESLDLCFDVMRTELAEIAVMLQRMGRLHRNWVNNQARNSQFNQPYLHVYLPSLSTNSDQPIQWFGGANCYIYLPSLLYKTAFCLHRRSKDGELELSLPIDIDELVQEVHSCVITDKMATMFPAMDQEYLDKWEQNTEKSAAYNQLIHYHHDVGKVCRSHHVLGEEAVKTRLAPPSVSLVITYKNKVGKVCLISDDQPIDLSTKPSRDSLKRIKGASVAVSNAEWVQHFLNEGQQPASWEKQYSLYDSYLLKLNDNNQYLGLANKVMSWHEVKGLMW